MNFFKYNAKNYIKDFSRIVLGHHILMNKIQLEKLEKSITFNSKISKHFFGIKSKFFLNKIHEVLKFVSYFIFLVRCS